MSNEPFCETCRKRLAREERRRDAKSWASVCFERIRRAIRVRFDRLRQAIRASSEIETELQLICAASLLAGAATVYLIFVFASIFSF